jgi:hypothetical protein
VVLCFAFVLVVADFVEALGEIKNLPVGIVLLSVPDALAKLGPLTAAVTQKNQAKKGDAKTKTTPAVACFDSEGRLINRKQRLFDRGIKPGNEITTECALPHPDDPDLQIARRDEGSIVDVSNDWVSVSFKKFGKLVSFPAVDFPVNDVVVTKGKGTIKDPRCDTYTHTHTRTHTHTHAHTHTP